MDERIRTQSEILKDIVQFSPSQGEWLQLDRLLDELWSEGPVGIDAIPILLGVFERFPEEDGSGVFWSIVHGIESLPFNYEPLLVASNDHSPSLMSDVMLARLANSRV